MHKKAFIKPLSAWVKNKAVPAVGRNIEALYAKSGASSKYLKDGRTGGANPEAMQSVREAARNMIRHPLATAKKGWQRMGTGEKALFTGMTAMQAPGIAHDKEHRGRRIAETAGGSVIPWLGLRRLPLAAQMLGWEGMQRGSSAIGNKLDSIGK